MASVSHAICAVYFSMEIALRATSLPTPGLGILAGDTLKPAANAGISLAGITLPHRTSYFDQHLDEHENQSERSCFWKASLLLVTSYTVRPDCVLCWTPLGSRGSPS